MKLAHRLTLKQLRALVAVADSASFTQAARLLHLTQPAISMQIRDAESIVGQVLVDGRREIHLTPAGEILVRAARQALHSLEMAEVELKARMGVAAGTLDVVAITTAEYFVPYLLAEFGRRYPEISFRLTVANREHVRALIQEQRCDVAGRQPASLDALEPASPMVGAGGLLQTAGVDLDAAIGDERQPEIRAGDGLQPVAQRVGIALGLIPVQEDVHAFQGLFPRYRGSFQQDWGR